METGSSDSKRRAETAIVVCGLGALGAECVAVFRRYGVPVRAIEIAEPTTADVTFVRGDCRRPEILRQAGIESCRAIVLVTGDPRVNVEAALAARRLNPAIRIVVRAPQDNINHLLSALLTNFVAYEPGRLAAGPLALAASHGEVIGYFRIDGRLVRILRRQVTADSPTSGTAVKHLERRGLMVLQHHSEADETAAPSDEDESQPFGPLFYRHDPQATIRDGDLLTLLSVEIGGELPRQARQRERRGLGERFMFLRRSLRRPAGVVLASLVVITLALGISALAFPSSDHALSAADGIFTALVLMTGGTYADLFPPFGHLSNRLRLLSVMLSATGTVFVGLLYAWLTERVVALRWRLGSRRPPVPRGDHVVVVGLGRLGRRASAVLRELDIPVAAVEVSNVDDHTIPGVPVVIGNGIEEGALAAVNVASARAVLAATRDDWINLEIALHVRRLNANCELVMRTEDARFAENVADLVPHMRALRVPVIAARAFAAAALGARVLDLFQLGDRMIYVVEHVVQRGDGLEGHLLAEIAEGYSVVPVWYAVAGDQPRFWSTTDQAVRLKAGDRLVLLAPSRSLQWIERGEMRTPAGNLRLASRRPYADPFALTALLVQHTACTLEEAQRLVHAMPQELPVALYPHQALRLRAALEAAGTVVEEVAIAPAPSPQPQPS